ncbi:MAG: exodeoxyribonuclease VII large subunit [Rikenellaceae bacterium]|nr:exodeoxyribonuclease VII large subunit [Rikenellaceae bacterium]
MRVEKHITLSELQQRIKSAVEQSLPLPVWVVAEIADCKVNSYSGHCYLELVEKEASDAKGSTGVPRAQVKAVIWRTQYAMLSSYFAAQTGSRLAAGMKIMAKVIVSYHQLYGLSLQITDIDPSYTLGEVEREKQQTIAHLQADGVWDDNRMLALPPLVQRLAVVSSATAAGYRDFCNELQQSGYAFRVELVESIVQGLAAEESICDALSLIAQREEEFDAVVIIRGGGSTSDLSCFNSYRLCSYVAQFPLPVITGIGHDKDTSVADMVAHLSLKTPTAVAAWLNERMASLEGWLDEAAQRLAESARAKTSAEALRIERWTGLIGQLATGLCQRSSSRLTLYGEQLRSATRLILEREKMRMGALSDAIDARDPHNILKRGFAVVRHNGAVQLSAESLTEGGIIDIELADGKLRAEIKEITRE